MNFPYLLDEDESEEETENEEEMEEDETEERDSEEDLKEEIESSKMLDGISEKELQRNRLKKVGYLQTHPCVYFYTNTCIYLFCIYF